MKTLKIGLAVLFGGYFLYMYPLMACVIFFGVIILGLGLRLFGMLSVLLGELMFGRRY